MTNDNFSSERIESLIRKNPDISIDQLLTYLAGDVEEIVIEKTSESIHLQEEECYNGGDLV
jgi:hypothetical protein